LPAPSIGNHGRHLDFFTFDAVTLFLFGHPNYAVSAAWKYLLEMFKRGRGRDWASPLCLLNDGASRRFRRLGFSLLLLIYPLLVLLREPRHKPVRLQF